MRNVTRSGAVCAALGLAAFLVASCAGSREAAEKRQARQQARLERAAAERREITLRPMAENLRTPQLYGGGDERQPPITSLRGGQPLTLEFDLVDATPRPLSVYFYHADRNWERDLMPVEYLTTFQRDDILDYSVSRGTDVPYVHYSYSFPNQNVGFSLSGNYVVRVTEQGDEEAVLFERPFFVTEQVVPLELQFGSALIGGPYPATLPILRFTPPADLAGDVFNYGVCFVRDSQYDRARCTDDPALVMQPDLLFELRPEQAFLPEPAEFFLDLSAVRVGPDVERADLSSIPPSVTLVPDYASFPGSAFAPPLNGQTLVSSVVQSVAEPDVSSEYVDVGFSLIPPDELPLSGTVYVVGSFSGWAVDPRNQLTWIPERRRYEGNVLLKQGQYEYRYVSADSRLQRAIASAPPSTENLYTAYIYYRDLRLNSDRLLSVQGAVNR